MGQADAQEPGARPTYAQFVARLHGDAGALRIVGRALAAGSLPEFWRRWNPAYGYLLRYYVHAPLRRRLPAQVARLLTFLLCGLVLHDLPFLYLPALLRGASPPPPFTTLLFLVFALQAELSTALRVSWAGRSLPTRVLANLLAIGAAGAVTLWAVAWVSS
ncbi:MAG: hypothetical protein M9894_20985 [Planctomycetes bacterium]|nr:hypothetical protein [Planctomycetota bacterium]